MPAQSAPLSVLVIDDDLGDRKLIRRNVRASSLVCTLHESAGIADALGRFGDIAVDFVFVDYGLPDADGISAIATIAEHWPDAAVAIITGQGSEETAAEAIKSGAADYISKRTLSPEVVAKAITAGVERARLQRRLEEHRRDLEDFAYTLAHDLKSPLISLGSLSTFIIEDLEAGYHHELSYYATEIRTLTLRLTTAIDDLSRYLELDAEPERQPEDLADLVEAAIINLREEFAGRDVDVDIGPLPTIDCARSEIILLFQNLLSNAAKYCPGRQPKISISAEKDARDQWCIAVADNGLGIPDDAADQIFRPFKRLHAASEIPGSGLGLSSCAKIVKRHGGRIWCAPRDVGTTFHFTLPEHGELVPQRYAS